MQRRTRLWLLLALLVCLIPASILLNRKWADRGDDRPDDTPARARAQDIAFFQAEMPKVVVPGFNTTVTDKPLKDYHFRFDWFGQNIPIWKKVLADFKDQPNVQYLEIGLFEGRSAMWMLENILTHPTSRLTGIDPFLDSFKDSPGVEGFKAIFFSNLELSGQKDRATIITGFSQAEMRKLPLDFFDIIYIDGSHVAVDVLEDAVLAHGLLKAGGVLIFDDYQWALERQTEQRPRAAIDAFYAFYKDQYDVAHNGYQLILRKKRPATTQNATTAPTTAATAPAAN